MTSEVFLPYGRQLVDDDDISAVIEVLRSDWLTTGPAVEHFEEALAKKVDAKYAVACSSGTAALHLAAAAVGLSAKDLAIVPSITFVATANCVRYTGAEVQFADVKPENGLLSKTTFKDALNVAKGNIKAVFPVHLNGHICDVAAISEIAKQSNVVVIEDASHAIGGSYFYNGKEHKIGSCAHSDLCAFSFHPVKTITMGEGGAITTNDETLASKMRSLRNHGITREPLEFTNKEMAFDNSDKPNAWYYEQHFLGFNYRATDIQCALGLSQLNKLPGFSKIRRELVNLYQKKFNDPTFFASPVIASPDSNPVLHLYPLQINFRHYGIQRNELMANLRRRGIGTQVHYIPVYLQPYYIKRYGKQLLQGASAYYENIISLPLHANMTENDLSRVVSTLRSELEG